jgi:hypothetical protein
MSDAAPDRGFIAIIRQRRSIRRIGESMKLLSRSCAAIKRSASARNCSSSPHTFARWAARASP